MTIETMTVKAGESVARTKHISTEKQTVQLGNVSKNKTTGQNYKVNWIFDFSKCTEEEILDLAGRSAVIAYRKHFKEAKEDEIEGFETCIVDVKKDVIASERVKKSPMAQAKNLLQGLSDEERQALLADLGL